MPIQVEMVNYHKNGTPYWASVSITPIQGKKDQRDGFVAIEKETTAQHQQLTSMEEPVVQVYNALLLSEGDEGTGIKCHG
jgi:c-di-GMP-specific phosphodiesterase